MCNHAEAHRVKNFRLPELGSGLDKLQSSIVHKIQHKIFQQTNVCIRICSRNNKVLKRNPWMDTEPKMIGKETEIGPKKFPTFWKPENVQQLKTKNTPENPRKELFLYATYKDRFLPNYVDNSWASFAMKSKKTSKTMPVINERAHRLRDQKIWCSSMYLSIKHRERQLQKDTRPYLLLTKQLSLLKNLSKKTFNL